MELSDRLRAERVRVGLTQLQAAEAMRIPVVTYRSYESGRSEPPMRSFARMMEAGFDAHFIALGKHLAEVADGQIDWSLVTELAHVIAEWSTARGRPLDLTEQANYLRLAHSWAILQGADSARDALQRMFKAA